MSELKRYEIDSDYPNDIVDGSYYDVDDVDAVLAEKDAEIQALKQKLMAYGDANARLSKENTDLKLITESRGTEVAQLKCDIADLRDDKKTTDAILDECNAKIDELQDRLRASEKQNKDLASSASQTTTLQDKALANSADAWAAIKKRFIGRSLGERKKGQ